MELLDQLLNRPDANILVDKAKAILASEQKKREQFYKDITPNDKAEFIQGKALFHSPVKGIHNQVTGRIFTLLNAYSATHNLGRVGIEKLLIALTRNDYEPDICFFKKEKSGQFTDDQMKFPAPDLIVEVLSKSTEEIDRGIKYLDYEAHGIGEYWIVDAEKQVVEQYVLVDGAYTLKHKSGDGHLKSESVEGFEIPVNAFFNDKDSLSSLRSLI